MNMVKKYTLAFCLAITLPLTCSCRMTSPVDDKELLLVNDSIQKVASLSAARVGVTISQKSSVQDTLNKTQINFAFKERQSNLVAVAGHIEHAGEGSFLFRFSLPGEQMFFMAESFSMNNLPISFTGALGNWYLLNPEQVSTLKGMAVQTGAAPLAYVAPDNPHDFAVAMKNELQSLTVFESVTLLDDQTYDGVICQGFHGKVNRSAVANLLIASMKKNSSLPGGVEYFLRSALTEYLKNAEATVYLGNEDRIMRKLTIDLNLQETRYKRFDATYDIALSMINSPAIVITTPENYGTFNQLLQTLATNNASLLLNANFLLPSDHTLYDPLQSMLNEWISTTPYLQSTPHSTVAVSPTSIY
ncbi:MAG: hypothetical protein WCP97_03205 [bacterium]